MLYQPHPDDEGVTQPWVEVVAVADCTGLDVLADLSEVFPSAVAAPGPAQQQVEDAVYAAARTLLA